MSRTNPATIGLLVALVLLVAGGPSQTGADNKALEDYELYPLVGYFLAFTSTNRNWTEAYETCVETYGGQMAVPNSETEADIYKDLIAGIDPAYHDCVWVGFHDLFINGKYETIHGYSVDNSGYPVWAPGSPNTIPSLRCGGFNKDGGLSNYNCAYRGNSTTICELPVWADYELVPGVGHYKLHVEATSWNNAWTKCKDEDSHLAVINSEEEYAALQEIFSKNPDIPAASSNLYAWVGVHAKFARNKFYTVSGTPLADTGYSTWEVGQPEEGINQSYTSVALTRENGHLTLQQIDFTLAFFCEHELYNN